ncbi:hypothetical protein HA402_005226 [Bradysia odoriphaga]|nr:hypothetical protein HA402_005226 [Bradysia odoriphaga]
MVGTNDLRSGRKRYEADRLISHELYNDTERTNDIALVEVKGSFEFNEKVQPIELEDGSRWYRSSTYWMGMGKL